MIERGLKPVWRRHSLYTHRHHLWQSKRAESLSPFSVPSSRLLLLMLMLAVDKLVFPLSIEGEYGWISLSVGLSIMPTGHNIWMEKRKRKKLDETRASASPFSFQNQSFTPYDRQPSIHYSIWHFFLFSFYFENFPVRVDFTLLDEENKKNQVTWAVCVCVCLVRCCII